MMALGGGIILIDPVALVMVEFPGFNVPVEVLRIFHESCTGVLFVALDGLIVREQLGSDGKAVAPTSAKYEK